MSDKPFAAPSSVQNPGAEQSAPEVHNPPALTSEQAQAENIKNLGTEPSTKFPLPKEFSKKTKKYEVGSIVEVEALREGYYKGNRYVKGDEFAVEIPPKGELGSWMKEKSPKAKGKK